MSTELTFFKKLVQTPLQFFIDTHFCGREPLIRYISVTFPKLFKLFSLLGTRRVASYCIVVYSG